MKRIILSLSKVLDKITLWLHELGGVCLVLVGILIMVELISRGLLNYSISITWEIGSYLLAASWFLSMGFTLRTDGHIRVVLFNQFLGEKGSWVLEVIATFFGVIITFLMLFALFNYLSIDSFVRGKTSYTPMRTPLFIPQMIMTLGMLVFFLQMLMRFLRLLIKEAPDIILPKSQELE